MYHTAQVHYLHHNAAVDLKKAARLEGMPYYAVARRPSLRSLQDVAMILSWIVEYSEYMGQLWKGVQTNEVQPTRNQSKPPLPKKRNPELSDHLHCFLLLLPGLAAT